MRKTLFTLFFVAFALIGYGQATIKGILVDADTNEPLIGASVIKKGTGEGVITDIDGSFMLEVAENAGIIEISYIGYGTTEYALDGSTSMYDLGTFGIATAAVGLEEVVITGVMDIVQDRRTPVAVSTINTVEIQAKSVGNVEFPEIMKNTPSVYVSNQTGFGDAQMFMRGFSQTNTAFLLNGQPINGMEDGRMYWSNWSGMSDVASAVQIQRGLGSSKLAISSVGGTINIVTRTVENDKGGFVRGMIGNDGYLKGTVSYNTGLNNKWAFSFLLDHWQANNKWADGTRGQGQNYFLSAGFKPNDSHTFNFLVTGAPQWHGNRWSQKLETLEAEPKFNQHWGEDQGKWESERRNFYHKPVLNLNWDFSINEKSSLASVLYASFGRGGGTGPFGSSRNRVRTDSGQVDFGAIRANNIADSDNLGSFSRNYALRASMNNHRWFGNVTNYSTALTDNIDWSVGADFRWYRGDHFRQFANLLGLDGWQDNFRHATRSGDAIQSDTFKPNPWTALFSFASEDQRIAYDYSETINYAGVFTQLEYGNDVFTAFVQGALSNQSYQREGRWATQGKSDKITKVGYNLKGGASYSLSNYSTIFANTGVYSRQPFLDNIFSNIRYSNELVTDENGGTVGNEDIVGFELGYKLETNDYRLNVNAYRTTWGGRTLVNVFTNDNDTPDDEGDDFAQRNIQRGLAQVHTGIEIDGAVRLNNALKLKAFASFGDWTYNGIDAFQAFNDETGAELTNITGGLNNEGVHIPNAPQTSIGAGIDYRASGFSVYLDYNFFDNLYQNNINFDEDQILTEDVGTLDSYGIFDLGASYTMELPSGKFVTFRGNVYNLFDTYYINQTDVFGYLNGNGLTWNFSTKYSF